MQVEHALDWLLENALGALRERMQEGAWADYRHAQLVYAIGGGKQPPEMPAVLKAQQED